ncbi:MAG: hypothetical protein IPI46_06110 [Bacteroidetes bacterium]|nr:hypothetical protein [Bacteroidota bacterium]
MKKLLSLGLLIIICITHLNLLDGFSHFNKKSTIEKSKSMNDIDDEKEQEKDDAKEKEKSDTEKDKFVVTDLIRHSVSFKPAQKLLCKSNINFSSQRFNNENFRLPCC